MPTIYRLKVAAPQILRSPSVPVKPACEPFQGPTGEMLHVYATWLLWWPGKQKLFTPLLSKLFLFTK